MKNILGLDLGTNSIGWSLLNYDFENKNGEIKGIGTRIIPLTQDVLGKFDAGQSHSQTEERTNYRGVRRLRQRHLLRRERLHRVLNILEFLPEHYQKSIDFDKNLGKFKNGLEVKLNYKPTEQSYEFLFCDSFHEMVSEFKAQGYDGPIPYDWTIYYLRKKAVKQKISPQELSWIILNFNQKRGYYQLRGEDTDTDNKEFVVLKVKELVDAETLIKGNKAFRVIFENDWEYDKLIVDESNWLNQTKEFIVTTTTLKDGTIKRSYKAVDSTQDWAAIKAKTEEDISASNLTVGEYIYNALLNEPTTKIRGKLVKTIERKFYKAELETILKTQAQFHSVFSDRNKYSKCIHDLYRNNISYRRTIQDKDLIYLIVEDIIFYQRPLKSKKSEIADCPFEFRTYYKLNETTNQKERVKQHLKVVHKSHPKFQEFRLLQWLANFKLIQLKQQIGSTIQYNVDVTNQFITPKIYDELFEFLTTKKEIDHKNIIDFLVKSKVIEKADKENFKWNYVYDEETATSKKYPMYETRFLLVSKLKNVTGLDNPVEFLLKKGKGDFETTEEHLWHLIYSITDQLVFEQALASFADSYSLQKESFVETFRKLPPFKSDYASLSLKAINRILPLMRFGKFWSLSAIDSKTSIRINKILNAEDDATIHDKVRAFAVNLTQVEDFSNLPFWFASYVVYNRFSETAEYSKWETPADIDNWLMKFKQHSLNNPIVEQVVTETLRVVRDIWQIHGNGKPNYFNEIHLELGREMKNPAAKRQAISKQNAENENTNLRIKQLLIELAKDSNYQAVRPYSPSQQEILKIYEEGVYQNPQASFSKVSEDEIQRIRRSNNPTQAEILKYKLWLEQGYVSPYTGKIIPLSKLFTPNYQIEHIIPQSRYFDDSFTNKVICESEVNEDKSNKTAMEYITEKSGSTINGHQLFTLAQYQKHIETYFRKNKRKRENLLANEIPEGFINRQLNDSRYISKLISRLLSNIVREENEEEVTSKNLIPVTGAITSKLKSDWGLNDKWNEIIAPRFERMNQLTNSNDFGYFDQSINAFRIQVPNELSKGFNKKRIDHRHHALDALIIACVTKKHINYLNALNNEKVKFELQPSLLIKNKEGHYTKNFQLPWKSFPVDAKHALETIIISFKQNNRVINKATNKYYKYVLQNGTYVKRLVPQTKGDNWAIRKSLHKDTVAGIYKQISTPKGKIATTTRVDLSAITNDKQFEKVIDGPPKEILKKHLQNFTNEKGKVNFEAAFDAVGVQNLNANIQALNNGKFHMPIYKVKQYEIGSKFSVGTNGNKGAKYVEAAKGTNLFFAIYYNEKKQKRVFDTVPLNEVIEHQKQVATLPAAERTPIQPKRDLGKFLFTLSPNDLVYVPTEEELQNPHLVLPNTFTTEQVNRIYKMVSCTGNRAFYLKYYISKSIVDKFEFSALNKMERSLEGEMIKEICWKLEVNKLGQITKIYKD